MKHLLFFILTLYILYCIYQILRCYKAYRIVIQWIDNEDWYRFYKYDYEKIHEISRENWYGLKWPNEKNYK